MTIAMIMSQNRLEQEHAMLSRLVVGLMNDGRQVVRIVPTSPDDELAKVERAMSLAKRLSVPMPVSRLRRSTRTEEVIEVLEKANTTAIVTFGKQSLQVAKDVSSILDIPILAEVVSMKEAKRTKTTSPVWRWFAATPTLHRIIQERVGDERAAFVPLGTTTPNRTKEDPETLTKKCVVILDAASSPKTTRSVLEVLSKVDDIHIFIELTGSKQHRVWRSVHALEIHDKVTCLHDMSALRSLIVHADLVILPATSVPIRTILLEAMRWDVPIVASPIDEFDMLVDEETALIARDDWTEPLNRILKDPLLAHRIGHAGSELVATHYASAAQIAAFDAAFSPI